jgi:Ca2+/Na+ antiporter
MLLPDILTVFDVTGVMDSPIYPVITMVLGGVGVLMHVINLVHKKQFTFTALTLLASIGFVIAGVSMSALDYGNMKYLTLAGLLLIVLWIAIPQKKSNKKADQD